MYVNTENKGALNLRAEPAISGKVLARIPYGTLLELRPKNETWSETTYNGITGYVMNKFLSTDLSPTVTKADLQKIYNSLKSTLQTIESILK
jgi:uncharacterized protein YgiM (DUF1202 family)